MASMLAKANLFLHSNNPNPRQGIKTLHGWSIKHSSPSIRITQILVRGLKRREGIAIAEPRIKSFE